ncbi:type VI immunity family protein [Ruegeria sp. PrR005]|uniref:DUF3396 domain-containing protein n=1 Tax=Ruegeria sp. PrR005 TaxID=2706882 RepID=A0A6B2NSS1_9RHOB|nr:type VI immunity family protein [Ruegeria sp. PrR005]NDW45539.1 DUF3396 domain-containing protein [Ruegeria sp. PrR005]
MNASVMPPIESLPLTLRAVFFIAENHHEILSRARQAIENYTRFAGLHNLKYFFDLEGQPQELTSETFDELLDMWFVDEFADWPNATIEIQGDGGTAPGYGLQYWGRDISVYPPNTRMSFLHFWLPFQELEQDTSSLQRLFARTTDLLGASFAFVSPSIAATQSVEATLRARRYWGLDISNPECVCIDLGRRAAGVYWIMYCGADLGLPRDTFLAFPGSDTGLILDHDAKGGTFVRLSEYPQILDMNRRPDIRLQTELALRLNSAGLLHTPQEVVHFKGHDLLADAVAQESWYTRFLPESPGYPDWAREQFGF